MNWWNNSEKNILKIAPDVFMGTNLDGFHCLNLFDNSTAVRNNNLLRNIDFEEYFSIARLRFVVVVSCVT